MQFKRLMLIGMGKISRWFGITCRDTSPLISERMDHSLPFSKRWRLQLHLAICEICRHYGEQLEIIRTLAHRLGEEKASIESKKKLSPEAKRSFQVVPGAGAYV